MTDRGPHVADATRMGAAADVTRVGAAAALMTAAVHLGQIALTRYVLH